MANFLESLTLTHVIGLLLILVSLWLIKIIIKKERRNVFMGMLLFLFLLATFLYLDLKVPEKWAFSDLKETLFPSKQTEIKYSVKQWSTLNNTFTRYTFKKPYPRLGVTLDERGKYFHLKNPGALNRVLKFLNIPEVEEGVQELASLTGSKDDVSRYRWDDYPLGVMVVEKTLSQNKTSLETHQALWRITITR
jgi:hypothetical protein